MATETAVTEWIEVATLKELTRHKKKLVTADGEQIALFYTNGNVYALQDICIHKQRSLSKGTLLRGRVICPGHQWAFDVETGWVEAQERCQPTYPVKVSGEIVYVNPQSRVLSEAPQ